ncbi:MAG: BRO family protein [Verrucomicrobiota bacterium]
MKNQDQHKNMTAKNAAEQTREFLFPVEGIEGKETATVRVVGTVDAPMFIAADVCDVLGLANSRQVLTGLDADEIASVLIPDTSSSTRKSITVQAVNESGLYHLIFKSRKPAAKRFRRWVTDEVLPEIRKTGSYDLSGTGSLVLLTMPEWLKMMEVDPREQVTNAELLMCRVEKASRLMRYQTASFRDADGFQRIPLPVLQMAAGLLERDMSSGHNQGFLATVPRLAGASYTR